MSIHKELETLDREIEGSVILPGDARYETAKEGFYTSFNSRRPSAVVRVAGAEDVSRVIKLAGDTGTRLAVRSGGHSVLGHSTIDGGLVIDLSGMKQVDIDAERRVGRAGGGVLAGEYTLAAAEHGLITGFGDAPSVGVTGITMGGGIGFLHRKLGLTIDSLIGAEIVTADGEVQRTDATNLPDLFWAIRGGGGNFGVVTGMEFRLHPLGTVLGGMMILPASARVVAYLVGLAGDASGDLSVIAAVMTAPPMPFLPTEVHGKTVVVGFMVHAGPEATAEAEVADFRKLATPLVDTVERLPFTAFYAEDEGPPQPAAMAIRSVFSDSFGTDHGEAALDALGDSTANMSVVQIRVLGGAVSRVPVADTAFAHRRRAMVVNVAAAYEVPSSATVHESWVAGLGDRLSNGPDGVYVNFTGDDSVETARRVYPGETWDRLVEVKTRYDPENVFSSNVNIPPRPITS